MHDKLINEYNAEVESFQNAVAEIIHDLCNWMPAPDSEWINLEALEKIERANWLINMARREFTS